MQLQQTKYILKYLDNALINIHANKISCGPYYGVIIEMLQNITFILLLIDYREAKQ